MKENLTEFAYSEIKTRILNGDFKQGEAVSINALTEKLHISRTPITNACQKLEHERLLTILPKQGVVIHTISIREARGIYELRTAIETYNARIVFPALNETDLSFLRDSINIQRDCAKQGSAKRFMEEDHRFHRFFLQKNINSELLSLINQLYDRAFMLGVVNSVSPRLSQSIAEHESILDAIQSGDALLFASAIENNIMNGFSAWLSFGSNPF